MSVLLPDFEGVISSQLNSYLSEIMAGVMANPLQVVEFGDDNELSDRHAAINVSVSHNSQNEFSQLSIMRSAQVSVIVRMAKIPNAMQEIGSIRRCVRTAIELLGEAKNTQLSVHGFSIYDTASQVGYEHQEFQMGEQSFIEMQFIYQIQISYINQ